MRSDLNLNFKFIPISHTYSLSTRGTLSGVPLDSDESISSFSTSEIFFIEVLISFWESNENI